MCLTLLCMMTSSYGNIFRVPGLLAFCGGNSPVTGELPAQRPVTRSFDSFVDLRLNKRLSNTRNAGNLRHHRTYYDVTSGGIAMIKFRESEQDLNLQRDICTAGVHYCDVIMFAMASQITSLAIIYSTVYSGADQRKHHSSALLAFVRGIHRWPVNSPQKMASNAENVSIWWRHHGRHITQNVLMDVPYIAKR